MNTIAMYLPQFHRIPENDRWWGEGYTEWTAVKKAEKLFEEHNQPRVPMDDNYYNLLEKSTMQWQAELAQKYKVDGFCFYHYYFKEGKKVLEKPAENLLAWKDINMPFCFCWANVTWARTWSKIDNSTWWTDKFEKGKQEESSNGILLEQDYGSEKDWKEHFYYLLPFFGDERYIKYEGKPVFLIYVPEKIYCLQRMIRYWNELAHQENIPGIYVIGANINHKMSGIDGILMLSPTANLNIELANKQLKSYKSQGVSVYDYTDMWNVSLKMKKIPESETYFGAVVDFDDTPRRGENGFCLRGTTPELFEENFYKLLEKSAALNNEFVFINAWNEWGEGMYLEPDEKNGFRYLEAVKRCVEKIENCDLSRLKAAVEPEPESAEINDLRKRIRKFRGYYEIVHQWLKLKEQGRSLEKYFTVNGYHDIAIYGWGELGQHLYEELKESQINVRYIVDRNAKSDGKIVSVDKLTEKDADVSAIVITAVFDFDNIYNDLKDRVNCPIISLEEVVMTSR